MRLASLPMALFAGRRAVHLAARPSIPTARSTTQQQLANMDTHLSSLVETSGVAAFLRSTPFDSSAVRRIQVGTTNFAYRLFLDKLVGRSQNSTAILKYSAPYTAGEPRVPFSAERQGFEALALTHIPWREFKYPPSSGQPEVGNEAGVNHEGGVKLPEVLFDDRENHVTIIEDCTPRPNAAPGVVWEQATHSFRELLEDTPETPAKHAVASDLGRRLGFFLAQLHAWGAGPGHAEATRLFGPNSSAKELSIEETLIDFFKNVAAAEYPINDERRGLLVAGLEGLEHDLRHKLETCIMGDFWMGNVLVNLEVPPSVSVIDWEFVMMSPAFVDVGNFTGELFLISYYEGTDSTYATVLEAFIKAYRQFGGPLDVQQAIRFAGAHIMMSLPRRLDSPRSKATRETAAPCVDQALNFITDPDFGYLSNRDQDPFAIIVQLMKDRQ